MSRRISVGALVLAALFAVAAIASGGTAKSSGVIQMTCQRCEASPSDVFSQSWYNVVQQFNTKYKSQYHVNVQHFGGQNENDLQYWERLDLASSLPDIFIVASTQLQTLDEDREDLQSRPGSRDDKAWKNTFYPGRLQSPHRPEGADLGDP